MLQLGTRLFLVINFRTCNFHVQKFITRKSLVPSCNTLAYRKCKKKQGNMVLSYNTKQVLLSTSFSLYLTWKNSQRKPQDTKILSKLLSAEFETGWYSCQNIIGLKEHTYRFESSWKTAFSLSWLNHLHQPPIVIYYRKHQKFINKQKKQTFAKVRNVRKLYTKFCNKIRYLRKKKEDWPYNNSRTSLV